LEQPREVARVRARQRDLRTLGRAPHLQHVRAHAVAGVVALARNLLALGQDRLRLADLEDDVALLDPVDDAAQDLAFLADELGVDALPLGVTDFLEDHLLGGLGGDASEILQRLVLKQLELDADLGLGIEGLGVSQCDLGLRVAHLVHDLLALIDAEVAGLAVDMDANVVARPQALAGGRQQGSLQRFEEDLFVDPLLAPELLDDHDQFAIHLSCDRLLQGTSASSTSPTSRLSRWQSSMPSPPGLSTNKRSTPRGRRGRHSRSTSVMP